MESSSAKKRTLSEQKESDVDPNKTSKSEEDGLRSEIVDVCETFKAYIKAKGESEKKEGTAVVLEDEIETLEEKYPDGRIPMKDVLNHVHGILLPQNVYDEMQQLINVINDMEDYEEDEEDEDEDVRVAKLAKKILDRLEDEVKAIKSEWEKKNYEGVFSKLFSVTYGGCIQKQWYVESKEDKTTIEAFFQTLSDLWTQLLTRADKEYCQGHLTTSDKHFINAMMDVLKRQTSTNGYAWTFQKLKLPNPEKLDWDNEQKKYDVDTVYYLSEDEDVEDSDNQSNSENQGDEDEDEGESGDEDNENGGVEPPTKKKKT